MNARRSIVSLHIAVALGTCLALLGGCQREPESTVTSPATTAPDAAMEWARAALARNPHLEIVASDATARVFTLRDKGSGEVLAVRLDDLAAAPIAHLTGSAGAQRLEATAAREPSSAPTPRDSATAAPEATPSESPSSAATTQTAANQNEDAAGSATSDYTIERADGQVRVTGPGVSIVSADAAGSTTGSAASQRTSEPIVCEGRRMLHLDNREIFVEGDAVTIRGGCELHITNSRIVATGTAVIVQDGTVHVSNSHIQGAENSFAADDRARMFVRSSTFQGLPRRSELAMIQDQGGNRYR